ncbi:hypothetical protein LX32DRAFT_319278 [Colletotrichum zoysiae]|uniref:Uncharacterized protein n=1 Tax=Colletotrichum zoysiae TaxID=1216348 RepID=A0AAD9LU66_9PEZI|nr:hypothetical protein LX32DRAFT_319278 [Colletotrichum zoysiae]
MLTGPVCDTGVRRARAGGWGGGELLWDSFRATCRVVTAREERHTCGVASTLFLIGGVLVSEEVPETESLGHLMNRSVVGSEGRRGLGLPVSV